MSGFAQQSLKREAPASPVVRAARVYDGRTSPGHGDERPASVAHMDLQAVLNESPRVQTQLQLGQALNESPRAVAQAKLASTLAERPATPAAEVVAQRQTDEDEEAAQRQTAEEEETLATQAKCSSAGCEEAGGEKGEGTLQGKFVYKEYNLGKYTDDIAEYIEANNGKKVATSFRKLAANKRNNDFEKWAKGRGRNVDWEQILIDIVGFDPAWEPELFSQRMEGMPLTGFVPVVTSGGQKTKMLEQVPRSGAGSFDYTSDEDMRILQTLRQISSQFYVYLEAANKLAKDEQEIQTMWAYGNLIIASNVPATLDALYTELNTLSVGVNGSQKLYEVLTGTYAPKKFLGVISERHGAKLNNLYQSIREPGSGHLKQIIEALAGANVSKITDVTDPTQIQQVANGSGNIYLVTSESPEGVSHAEQRLVEFRNLLEAYKKDPKAWVAGKKRPCFGCWIKLKSTNDEQPYELVYMNQPGKAFMGTYRAAEPSGKEEWYDTLQDQSTTFYESQVGRGEIGPESESEAEDEISYDDPEKLMNAIASDELTEPQLEAINFFSGKAGVDTKRVAKYVGKKRKNGDDAVDPKEEDHLELSAKKWEDFAKSSTNPGVKKAFGFKTNYKKKVPPKKKIKVQPTTP